MTATKMPSMNLEAVRAGSHEAVVFAMAALAAQWRAIADPRIARTLKPSHVASLGDSSKAGLLAASMELHDLLAQSPDGRQALSDLGLEPLFQNVKRE